jgi:hypothetical protein
MTAAEIKQIAGEGISCELNLVDWESTLDFLCGEHDLSAEDREKVSKKLHTIVHNLIVKL